MKNTRWISWLFGCVLLSAPMLVHATEAPPEETTLEVRQPTLRRIHPKRDAEAIERIELHRARLPVQYRGRRNFAWAMVWTREIDKHEYFAHSGIQTLDVFSSEMAGQLAGISVKPKSGRYYTLCVNQRDLVDGPDCWQRTVDTEYKIIEDLVTRLPDPMVRGRLKLYTDLPPCASCWNVLKQFMAEYPHMRVQVLYGFK